MEQENIGGQKKAWKILVQYKELTAFLQVVDGTQDSAASLPKAATMRKLMKNSYWMGEYVWKYLLEEWQLDEFKQVSEQNKKNQASTKSGAVHTSRHRAHHDVSLDMKLNRPPNPGELFMVTHKKKDGKWVDRCAEKTHEDYMNLLT
ncbi:hypothetical protein RYX36_029909 [Vicia faba]